MTPIEGKVELLMVEVDLLRRHQRFIQRLNAIASATLVPVLLLALRSDESGGSLFGPKAKYVFAYLIIVVTLFALMQWRERSQSAQKLASKRHAVLTSLAKSEIKQ